MTLTQDGEVVVDRLILALIDRSHNVQPAWPKVVEVFQAIEARAFSTEGGSTGQPWKPLAPSTQGDRRRKGFGAAHPILERTGTLKRALSTGEGAYVRMTPTAMQYLLSSVAGYFKYHQSRAPRTRLPRRAPVQFTADDRTAIVHPIRLYVTGRDINAPQRQRIT